jgi:hypothetical protein
VSPDTRLLRPRAIVSTSGSSGTVSGYRLRRLGSRLSGDRLRSQSAGPKACSSCSSAVRFGMLGRTHQAPPKIPVPSQFPAAEQPVCATLGRPEGRTNSMWSKH